MQHGLAQGGEAGVGVLVGHVGLGGRGASFESERETGSGASLEVSAKS